MPSPDQSTADLSPEQIALANTIAPPVPHYSQGDEQKVICDYFDKNPPKFGRRLLDIGAWNGVTFSNSRALVEHGWQAVLVEAAAGPFVDLMVACRAFPATRLVHSFIIGSKTPLHQSRMVRFHHTHDAISTADERVYEAWKGCAGYFQHMMPVTRVDELLEAFPGPYDMVTIDTEGETFSIFCDILDMADISLIVVEHAVGGESVIEQMRSIATLKGYREIAANGENLIIAKI